MSRSLGTHRCVTWRPRKGSARSGGRPKPACVRECHDEELNPKDLIGAAFAVGLETLNTALDFFDVGVHFGTCWEGVLSVHHDVNKQGMVQEGIVSRRNSEGSDALHDPSML